MLITVLYLIWPEGHWEPHNKGGSQKPAEYINGVEQVPIRI